MTAPLCGLTSTTPIGSCPLSWLASFIETRACELIAGTKLPPRNHGKLDWVIFTSTIDAAQGFLSPGRAGSLKFVPPLEKYLSELITMWTFASGVFPTWTLYG